MTPHPLAYRLPQNVWPRQYDIHLDARLGSPTFSGHVGIALEVAQPTKTIELHARGLRIAAATIASGASDHARAASVALDAERELAVIDTGELLPVGTARLEIDYDANISTGLQGLFVSKSGPDELLVTQCESTGARAILPCFDEPIFKARFAWRVTTDAGTTVLTNGALVSDEPSADGASHTCAFATTPPMSTYLIALAAGDLASTPPRVVEGVPLGIWALRGKEHLGDFALEYTARLLPFYNDYFAIPYHFGKLDQVAVPSFGAGAMENAGLIVSQATVLLIDEEQASLRQRLSVAYIIAHEFAHMWFGDLVTMRWWDDIWLNEAFANWMESHAVDTLTPEYHIWDEQRAMVERALQVDSLAGTHPVYNPVETPLGINENFDTITYEKGGAVLRMIHDFLGDETFRAGLRTYMREFAERNASGADLWRHLQAASNLPVGDVMESWIHQAGHPIISVALESEAPSARLRISQRRFFADPDVPPTDQLWQVPVVLRYADANGVHERRYLLTERSASVDLDTTGTLLWCYPNAGEVGFYRSQLDATLSDRLDAHLDALTSAEQKGWLRDNWAEVANAAQPITRYLDALAGLTATTDHTLLTQIVNEHLGRVLDLLEDVDDQQALTSFRAWVGHHFANRLASLGYAPRELESETNVLLRSAVIAAMTHYAEDPAAIAQAKEWQQREATDPTSVDANIAGVIVSATAEFGDAQTYDDYLRIWEQRKTGHYTPQQVDRYSFAFARFLKPELVARTLQLFDEDVFSLQLIASLTVAFLRQHATQHAAWEYVKSHWDTIHERAPFFAPVLVEASGALPGDLRGDVARFWEDKLHGELAGPLARALERIDQRVALEARTRADLLAYFAPKSDGGTGNETASTGTSTNGHASSNAASPRAAQPEPQSGPSASSGSDAPQGLLRRLFGR